MVPRTSSFVRLVLGAATRSGPAAAAAESAGVWRALLGVRGAGGGRAASASGARSDRRTSGPLASTDGRGAASAAGGLFAFAASAPSRAERTAPVSDGGNAGASAGEGFGTDGGEAVRLALARRAFDRVRNSPFSAVTVPTSTCCTIPTTSNRTAARRAPPMANRGHGRGEG